MSVVVEEEEEGRGYRCRINSRLGIRGGIDRRLRRGGFRSISDGVGLLYGMARDLGGGEGVWG